MNFKVFIFACYPPYVVACEISLRLSQNNRNTQKPAHRRLKQVMYNTELMCVPCWILIAVSAVSNRQWKGC